MHLLSRLPYYHKMNSNRKEIDAEHVSGFSSIAKYQISRDISFGSVVCFQFFITSYWHFSLSISPFFLSFDSITYYKLVWINSIFVWKQAAARRIRTSNTHMHLHTYNVYFGLWLLHRKNIRLVWCGCYSGIKSRFFLFNEIGAIFDTS